MEKELYVKELNNNLFEDLLEKVEEKNTTIGIIGLGYVGLPIMVEFYNKGFKNIIGFDVNKEKIKELKKGKTKIETTDKETIKKIKNKIKYYDNFENIDECDCIIICVPTPLKNKEMDISFIKQSFISIIDNCKTRKKRLIVLESTTYPGCTDFLYRSFLEKESGNYLLAFSPERIDPGNKKYKLKNTPKILGGYNEESTLIGKKLYENICDVIEVSNTRTAEMVKLLENIYRLVNISLINELKQGCDKLNIDIWEVIEAAKTKPYGFNAFYPGPGIGGHCIPIDPQYYNDALSRYNKDSILIKESLDINNNLPEYYLNKIELEINKPLKGLKFLLIGLSYKKDVGDDRESPSYKFWDMLEEKGAIVDYYDPFITESREKKSIDLGKVKDNYDIGIILINHEIFNVVQFEKCCTIVFDTKNMFKQEIYEHSNIKKI